MCARDLWAVAARVRDLGKNCFCVDLRIFIGLQGGRKIDCYCVDLRIYIGLQGGRKIDCFAIRRIGNYKLEMGKARLSWRI